MAKAWSMLGILTVMMLGLSGGLPATAMASVHPQQNVPGHAVGTLPLVPFDGQDGSGQAVGTLPLVPFDGQDGSGQAVGTLPLVPFDGQDGSGQ
ncbi:MAG TPA: hypothetical protein VEZ44_14845 [bacterium]|nr:hypothetical protein [bacterium]